MTLYRPAACVLLLAPIACGGSPAGQDGGSTNGGITSGPGCDGGDRNTFAGACGPDGGPLVSCVLGVWLAEAPPLPCTSPGGCLADSGVPECAESDCQLSGYSLYSSVGTYFQGGYAESQTLGTFSSLLLPIKEIYEIVDGGVLTGETAATARWYPLSCTATEIDLAGFSLAMRASRVLSDDIEEYVLDAGGSWKSQPYP